MAQPEQNKHRTLRKLGLRGLLPLVVVLVAAVLFLHVRTAHAAACPAPSSDFGTVTSSVNITTANTYRVWSRIQPGTTSADNSYDLEIDGSTCFVVGGSTSLPASTWTWVDYQNGNTSSFTDIALTAGSHTIKMVGTEDGVKLDRVLFLLPSDSCAPPTGNGDACASAGDTTPPTTSITAPANNAKISGTIGFNANAADDVGVSKVEFYRGTTLLATDTTAPYTYSWDTTTVADGAYALTTKAYDAAGNITTSTAVNVTVDNSPPTSALTAPANGATVSGSATAITATASDSNGISKVELLIDGTISGTDTSSPYAFSWNTTTATNGSHTLVARAVDAAGNFTDSTPVVVTVDNSAPVTSITSPASGASVKGSTTVTSNATDNVGVARVEFYVDGTLKSTDTTSPYSFTWDTTTATNGSHSLTTKAYDAAGNVTTSTAVSVTVDNSAPTVTLTAPTNGSTVSGSVNLAATASDNVGVTKVEFFVGSTLLNSDTTSPYTISWDTTAIANGSYAITAKALDAAGNITTSSTSTVTVNNTATPPPDTTKPTVSITTPANNATVGGNATINVNAADNVGVTQVQIFRGSTLIDTDSNAPYTYVWDTTSVADGSYALTAKAFDAAGNNTTSSTVNVTVHNAVTVPGDVNGDGHVNVFDLSILVSHFNASSATRAIGDLNGDGVVNVFDLSILITNFGI